MQSISRSLRLPQGPSKGRYHDLSIKKFAFSFMHTSKIILCYNYIYLLARACVCYCKPLFAIQNLANAILDISLLGY